MIAAFKGGFTHEQSKRFRSEWMKVMNTEIGERE